MKAPHGLALVVCMCCLAGWSAVGTAAGQSDAPIRPAAPVPQPAPFASAGQEPLKPPPMHGPMEGPPPPDIAEITYEEGTLGPKGRILARNVRITVGEYTVTGGRAEGDLDSEVVLTEGPTLTYRGQVLTGDEIRFSPHTRAFRIRNLHTALTPDFLNDRLLSPLYLGGGDIQGTRRGPMIGEDLDVTTCSRPIPHYSFQARELSVEPGKRIVLRRALFTLWKHRLVTLPTLIIPLDRRIHRRAGYTPQFGRTAEEGFFMKSALNYLMADRIPGLIRLDLMEKKGIGTGVEQDWNLARVAGALAFYAIPTGGVNRNVSGRLNNRLNLGAGQALTLSGDFQRNSYLSLPETTNFTSRLGYARNTPGFSTSLNINEMGTDSANYSTRSLTANLSQTARLWRSLNASLNTDFSEFQSSFGSGSIQRTDQLTTRFLLEDTHPNYSLQLVTSGNVAIGRGAAQSFFGGVERLPELSLTNYRFTHGFLSRIPATFQLSVGRFVEGTGLVSGPSNISTERAVAGFDISGMRQRLGSSADLNLSGGFQQYFYGDGAAQYVIKNTATLTMRFWRKSGLRFVYNYQRPEGGSPFRFDQQGEFHTLTADAGWLDDRRLQISARVGYDFAQSGFPGSPAQSWQSLSLNLLARPVDWARIQQLVSFDPNRGKMIALTNDLRLRGRSDFSLDMVSRYDPQRSRLGAVNAQFNVPIGNVWRVLGIVQFNGYLNRFESRSFQLIRDFHCLEASLTYIENPYGFRSDRQILFQLRIKAIPLFQGFGVGQFGQALDTGLGAIY